VRYRRYYVRRKGNRRTVVSTGPLASGAWFFIGVIFVVSLCLQIGHWARHHVGDDLIIVPCVIAWLVFVRLVINKKR
jgi:hypothetical protein